VARKPDSGGGEKISKAFAYREAEAALGKEADLDAVQQFISEKFGIDMRKTQISQYRSNEKKRGGKKGRRGRKPKVAVAAEAAVSAAPRAGRGGNSDILIEIVSTVRGWENKLGAEKICEVIDALYKKAR
jgi:hypothetical protein